MREGRSSVGAERPRQRSRERQRSYLLTFLGEQSEDSFEPVVWRFRFKDPRTGQRHGFASLLFALSLCARTEDSARRSV